MLCYWPWTLHDFCLFIGGLSVSFFLKGQWVHLVFQFSNKVRSHYYCKNYYQSNQLSFGKGNKGSAEQYIENSIQSKEDNLKKICVNCANMDTN